MPSNGIVDARSEILSCVTIGELCAALLRFCRANQSWLVKAISSYDLKVQIDGLTAAFADWIAEGGLIVLPQTKSRIVELLNLSDHPALDARAMACAIDNVGAQWIRAGAQQVSEHELFDGTPFVHPFIDLKKCYPAGYHFSTSPLNRPNELDPVAVNCMTLGDSSASGISVIVDSVTGEFIDRSFQGALPVFGAAQPNASVTELYIPGSGVELFGVRPNDEERQNTIVVQLLKSAKQWGVNICVVPELSTFISTLNQVLEMDADALPEAICLGSQHLAVGSRRVNQGILVFPRFGIVRYHEKISRFTYRSGGHSSIEAIDTGRVIRIHRGSEWSMVVLTCADALDQGIMRIVHRLRPSIVLVAAMSEKLDPFRSMTSELVELAQSHVVVANNPRGWSDGAIFGRPLAKSSGSPVVSGTSPYDSPAVATLPVDASDLKWFS